MCFSLEPPHPQSDYKNIPLAHSRVFLDNSESGEPSHSEKNILWSEYSVPSRRLIADGHVAEK